MSKPDARVIAISSIRENPVALRTVNRESEEFIGLCDSIREVGLMNAFTVRERTEEVDGKSTTFYELIDGLHRYTACCEAGIKEVSVRVMALNDAEALEAQIIGNIHRIETKPVEYTKQLQRMFSANPTLTLTEMAVKVAKSPAWVSQRLNLLKLDPAIQKFVDDGKLSVSNAVQLAKLPVAEQLNYLDQSMTMGSEEFVPLVQARAKELRDAARQGRDAAPAVFVPLPRMQKMPILKAEYETPTVGPELCKKYKAKTGPEGFALGIAFALSLDPANIEIRTAADAEKKANLKIEKDKRAAERAKKKAEEATKLAAKAAEVVNVG